MELNKYLQELSKEIAQPLYNILNSQKNLCLDENHELTKYGKKLVRLYEDYVIALIENSLRK